jgi:hypothetical protein
VRPVVVDARGAPRALDHLVYPTGDGRSVVVPIEQLWVRRYAGRREDMTDAKHALVVAELEAALQYELDRRDMELIEDPILHPEEDWERNYLHYRMVGYAISVWKGDVWASARAAVAEDQDVIRKAGGQW